jgi:PGF-CTERM protein
MNGEQRTTSEATPRPTRRRFLAGAAAAGALTTGIATTIGRADAQSVTARLVVAEDAPTLEQDDLTGLLIAVTDQGLTDASDTDVATCEGLEDDRIISYQLEISNEDSSETAEATGFAARDNEAIQPERQFIVSDQEPCGDGWLHLMLEQVTESTIEVTETSPSTTSTSIPGFGVGTAVAGVTAATLGAAWRSLRS